MEQKDKIYKKRRKLTIDERITKNTQKRDRGVYARGQYGVGGRRG